MQTGCSLPGGVGQGDAGPAGPPLLKPWVDTMAAITVTTIQGLWKQKSALIPPGGSGIPSMPLPSSWWLSVLLDPRPGHCRLYLCLHRAVSPGCVWVQSPPFLEQGQRLGVGPHPRWGCTHLDHICKNLISKWGHVDRFWAGGFQHVLGGHGSIWLQRGLSRTQCWRRMWMDSEDSRRPFEMGQRRSRWLSGQEMQRGGELWSLSPTIGRAVMWKKQRVCFS